MTTDGNQPGVTHLDHTIAPVPPPDAPPPDGAPDPSSFAAVAAEVPPQPAEPEPAPVATPTVPESAPTTFRDELSRRGLDTSQFADDAAAYDHVAQQAAVAADPRWQQLAQLGQAVSPNYDQFQEFLQQQQVAQAEPTVESKPEPFFAPLPEWNPADEQRLQRNPDTGVIEIRPEFALSAHPDLARRYESYQQVKQANMQKLLANPYGAVQQQVETAIASKVEELTKQQTEASQMQVEQHRVEQLNNATLINPQLGLIEFDNGRPKVHPQTGDIIATPRGQAYISARDYLLQQQGVPADQVVPLAMQMVTGFQGGNGQPPATPQATTPVPSVASPASPAQQMQEQFLQEGYMADRGGSIVAAQQPQGPPQGPALDFADVAKEMAGSGQLPAP